jgi:FtsP/CotA-like multicopper oxidase with cupredoxin domain
MGAEKGTFAFGRPAFVAGAAIGSAIGNAVRQNTAYNACMETQGFVAVDEQQKAVAPTPAAAASANANRPYMPGEYYTPAAASSAAASPCGDGPGAASGGPGQELVIRCGDR